MHEFELVREGSPGSSVQLDLPDWHRGPAPLAFQPVDGSDRASAAMEMDAPTRLGYLSDRVGPTLYGARYWRGFTFHDSTGAAYSYLLELLVRPAGSEGRYSCIFVMHADGPAGAIGDVRARVQEAVLTARDCLAASIGGSATVLDTSGRSFVLTFAATTDHPGRPLPEEYSNWEAKEQFAWALSTGWSGNPSTLPPSNEISRLRGLGCVLMPVRSTTIVVAHDGAAFVVSGSSPSAASNVSKWMAGATPDDHSAQAHTEWHVHSLFVDCFLIGLLQRAGLNTIADNFSALAVHRPGVKEMVALERRLAEFKSSTWWHQVTEERTANDLMRAFQSQHRLDDLLAEVGRDIAHYSGQVQALSNARSSAAVTVLTIVLVPVTVLCALVAALLPDGTRDLVKGAVFAGVVPASLLIGWIVAARIPGYTRFLRDVFSAGEE